MQDLVRWEPFRDTDEFFRSFFQPSERRDRASDALGSGSRQRWMPVVDIRETDSEYTVIAEMPGIRREDVKVRVEGDVLTLQGERNDESESQAGRTQRVERRYGLCSRRFALPEDAEAEKITADCKNGVVTVRIPKRAGARSESREIAVQ